MSFKTIRILTAALAAGLVLACLAGPGSAKDIDKQHIKWLSIYPRDFPDMTALELMQVAKDRVEQREIKARIEAGEKIEYGQLTVTSQPGGASVLVSSYVPLGKTPYANDKLLPGIHRVTVRKEGYYEQVRMVEIKANQQAAWISSSSPSPMPT